jgi:hypothetical protein
MYDISYPGIVQWNKMVFEKLGYMVLAFHHKHYDATESYKNCVENLKKAIKENMEKEGTSKDRLTDYGVMYRNINILLDHIEKDFKVNESNRNNKSLNNRQNRPLTNNRVSLTEEVLVGGKKSSKKSSKKPSKKSSKK